MRDNLKNSFTKHFPAKASLPKGKLRKLYVMVLVSDIGVLDFSRSLVVSEPKPYTTFCSQPARERNTILTIMSGKTALSTSDTLQYFSSNIRQFTSSNVTQITCSGYDFQFSGSTLVQHTSATSRPI